MSASQLVKRDAPEDLVQGLPLKSASPGTIALETDSSNKSLSEDYESVDLENLTLFDLLAPESIQSIQDSFAEATGVAVTIRDLDGNPLTTGSNYCGVCQIIRDTEEGAQRCAESGKALGDDVRDSMKSFYRPCSSIGFVDAAAPIIVGGRHVANWTIGQINPGYVDEDRVIEYALEIGADPESMLKAFQDMESMPLNRFQRILDFSWELAREISGMAHKNLKLKNQNQALKSIQQELFDAREKLETRVHERTEQLAKINESLRQEIDERRQAEHELTDANELLKGLLSTAATGIFTVDLCKTVTSVSDEFCKITGYKEHEVLGQKCTYFAEEPCSGKCGLLSLQQGQRIDHRQCTIRTRDGGLLTVLKNAAPMVNKDGQITGGIESFVDVTELIESKNAAESANRVKSEFLANMSHEIRTPMNGVVGMIELALKTEISDQQRDFLETASTSANALLKVINDILDFSKMEANKLELTQEHFDLEDCLVGSLASLSAQAHSKGLEITYNMPPNTPKNLIGDPGRLRQIFMNLIGNAVKFTEKGEVVVEVMKNGISESDITLQFSIKDTGPGISQENMDSIFGAFDQVDNSSTRKHGGTGLGLAICAKIVKLMEGEIWVESEINKGATFHFTANFVLGMAESRQKPLSGNISLEGVRALVVDDNETNRRILEQVLTNWGMKPVCVSSGAEALRLLSEAGKNGDSFKLALIDCMMPVMDGFELATITKNSPDFELDSVIMLTSANLNHNPQDLKDVGISTTLLKPVKQSDLYNAIINELAEKTEYGFPKENEDTVEKHNPSCRILVAEDNRINQKVASNMLESLGHSATIVANGKKAFEAYQAGSFDAILMDVHMPEMDGFEATRRIRSIEFRTSTKTPIIAMTAKAMKGDREKCIEAGMDDYIAKPIKMDGLRSVLDKWLSSEDGKDEANSEPVIIDMDTLNDQTRGDKDLLNELISIFKEDVPVMLEQMQSALESNDTTSFKEYAHSIKGSVSYFGSEPVFNAALDCELSADDSDTEDLKKNLNVLIKRTSQLEQALDKLTEETGNESSNS